MERFQRAFGRGEIYPLLRGARLLRMEDCAEADFWMAVRLMQDSGFLEYDAWSEAGSRFATYIGDGRTWNLSFQPKTGMLRIVSDGARNLAPIAAAHSDISVHPLVTQGRLLYYAHDCGMLYVIRLSDGRFIVIDGGMAEYDEPEHFLEILEGQNVRDGVPQIAAWFITHAHDDHFSLFVRVCERLYDRVKVDSIVYNWARPEYFTRCSDLTGFDRALEEHPEINVIAAHTGQRFVYPGAEFRVLYTHEDRCPDFLNSFNDTSTVMRMEICGRRVLWTGDAMRETADLLCREYPAESLRCEFLQVAHHGYSGGSDELYRAVDPETLLWPCPNFWYHTQSLLECNRYFMESTKIKAMFMSGREEITLDMTEEVTPGDPYAKYDAARPGDTLWEQDFAGKGVYGLLMSAITGGRTNYKSARLSLEKDGLRMTAFPEQYSVCELMQPGMLRGARGFTLHLRGRAERVGTAALFWNYEKPWEYSQDEALCLGLEPGKAFDIELKADGEAGRAELIKNGETVRTIEFAQARQRGVYLVLMDTEIVLRAARIVR